MFADSGWKWFRLILFHFEHFKLKIMKHRQKHNKLVEKCPLVSAASRFPKLCFYNHKVTLFFFFFHCFLSDFYQNPNNDWLITLHSDPSIFIKREKNKLFARILVHKLRLHCLKNYVINPNQDFWILMTTLLPNNIYINTYNMWYVISSTIISKDKRWTQKKKRLPR